ncbi:YlbF family regulator [Paraclostridium bifermentans]|uniref:YlbF family regulator n=1 Tax=Paraclostridium bifermentans TaxID=1490 RepID=UPI00359CA14C
MGIYDSTTKLASDIKSSKEYKEFKKYMKIVKNNPKYESILNNYRKIQMEIKSRSMNGVTVDKNTIKTEQELRKIISNNKELSKYLDSEYKFTSMMEKINKILASAVYEDYR